MQIELEQFVNDPATRTIVSETIRCASHSEVDFYSTPACFLLGEDALVPQVGNIESPPQSL